MSMLLITIFIIILNIVAIALVYYCLENMEKKEKIIFIGAGIAVIYILTSFVYWISTQNVEIKEVSEMGKNLITLLFVPVNAIIVLPLLAKSYRKYSAGKLKADKFRNRVIVLTIILAILLIMECTYFKDIQNSVVNMIENNQKNQQEQGYNITLNKNEVDPNLDLNLIAEDGITYGNNIQSNDIMNEEETNEENQIENNNMTNWE